MWKGEAWGRGEGGGGTCNGFELLTVLSSRDRSRLTDCNSEDQVENYPPSSLPPPPGLPPPHAALCLPLESLRSGSS